MLFVFSLAQPTKYGLQTPLQSKSQPQGQNDSLFLRPLHPIPIPQIS